LANQKADDLAIKIKELRTVLERIGPATERQKILNPD
jgi:hypothetical protein